MESRYGTFKDFYPLYSFIGDWRLWAQILGGRIRL